MEHGTFALGFGRYGLFDEFHQLARAAFDATELFVGHRLPEALGGLPRDPQHPHPGIYPRPNNPQGWSASAVILIVQALLGLRPVAPLGVVLVDPHLPSWLSDLRLENLRVGKGTVDFEVWRDDRGRTRYRTRARGVRVLRQRPPTLRRDRRWAPAGAVLVAAMNRRDTVVGAGRQRGSRRRLGAGQRTSCPGCHRPGGGAAGRGRLATSVQRRTDAEEAAADARERLNKATQPATARELGDAQDEVAAAEIALERARRRNAASAEPLTRLTTRYAGVQRLSKRRQDELTEAQLEARSAALGEKKRRGGVGGRTRAADGDAEQGQDPHRGDHRRTESAGAGRAQRHRGDQGPRPRPAAAGRGTPPQPSVRPELEAAERSLADARQRVADASPDLVERQNAFDAIRELWGEAGTAEDKLRRIIKRQLERRELQPLLRAELEETWKALLGPAGPVQTIGGGGMIPSILEHGGIFDPATLGIVGEAGREVVVPLTRPAPAVELAEESGLTDLSARQGQGSPERRRPRRRRAGELRSPSAASCRRGWPVLPG